jgi:spectinomycin phosphotransferase
MIEKLHLSDALIIRCIEEHYRLKIIDLEFLALGNAPHTWVYMISTSDAMRYFLKIKQGEVTFTSVNIPYYLLDSGIKQVVASVPTKSGHLWTSLHEYSLILYPYIDGKSGLQVGLSIDQWRELGAILRNIHLTHLPSTIRSLIEYESFVLKPSWLHTINTLQQMLGHHGHKSGFDVEFTTFWLEHLTEINGIVKRASELGQLLSKRMLPFVLCHSDIHTANILVNEQNQLFIVDWDRPILAPQERDIMFILEGIEPHSHSEHAFILGYGETRLDPLALAYYRYEWVVQELGEYGEQLCFSTNSGLETKIAALAGLKQLFEPRDVIESAYKADQYLNQ